jgi:hypothetical protein
MTSPANAQLPLADEPVQGRLAARVTCRRCHRPLHAPESRARRLGPDCDHQREHTTRHDVDQDMLPGL